MSAEMLLLAASVLIRPDPATTPGALNLAVTQANLQKTVCVANWTASIRPSSAYTTKLKKEQLHGLGLHGLPASYEEDHLISLELGGHPMDPKNLWPERWTGTCGAHAKDRLENALHRLVCSGQVPLAQAQHEIATDWVATSYHARIGPLSCGAQP